MYCSVVESFFLCILLSKLRRPLSYVCPVLFQPRPPHAPWHSTCGILAWKHPSSPIPSHPVSEIARHSSLILVALESCWMTDLYLVPTSLLGKKACSTCCYWQHDGNITSQLPYALHLFQEARQKVNGTWDHAGSSPWCIWVNCTGSFPHACAPMARCWQTSFRGSSPSIVLWPTLDQMFSCTTQVWDPCFGGEGILFVVLQLSTLLFFVIRSISFTQCVWGHQRREVFFPLCQVQDSCTIPSLGHKPAFLLLVVKGSFLHVSLFRSLKCGLLILSFLQSTDPVVLSDPICLLSVFIFLHLFGNFHCSTSWFCVHVEHSWKSTSAYFFCFHNPSSAFAHFPPGPCVSVCAPTPPRCCAVAVAAAPSSSRAGAAQCVAGWFWNPFAGRCRDLSLHRGTTSLPSFVPSAWVYALHWEVRFVC